MAKTKGIKAWLIESRGIAADATAEQFKAAVKNAIKDGSLTVEMLKDWTADDVAEDFFPSADSTGPTSRDVFGGGQPRVKAPSQRYSETKYTAKHAKTGLPVKDERGREVETVSEREFALAGAYLKHRAARDGLAVELNEHERELVNEMYADHSWCGKIGGQWQRGIPGLQVKALLSDATSGGQEINPEWFDTAIVTFPLLHGELFPQVDLQEVPRGAAVEGASVGNPTVIWGTSEGTALTLFSTADLVAAIDTTIHPVAVAVEIGRDMMSDAAVDVGRRLVENIGQRNSAELDKVVAVGDGTTQPQGVSLASGITSIPSANAGIGPWTVGDLESLAFGVGKQYRTAALRPAFVGSDLQYRRVRGMPIGTDDARRALGMDHSSYMALEWPFRVANDIADGTLFYGCLAKYRLYRRQGSEVRFTDQGQTLGLKNTALLLVRGRYGGKVVDSSAFTKVTDGPTSG